MADTPIEGPRGVSPSERAASRLRVTWPVAIGLVALALAVGFLAGSWNSTPTIEVASNPPGFDRDPPADDLREASLGASHNTRQHPEDSATPGAPPAPPEIARVPWDRTCTLTGRLIGEDGLPAAQTSICCRIQFGAHSMGEYTSTDGEGRFRTTLRAAVPAGEAGVLWIRRGAVPYRSYEPYVPESHGAYAALPESIPVGELELGDVRLQEEPRLVGGRLVDRARTPLPGVGVEVRTWRDRDEVPLIHSLGSDESGEFGLYAGRFEEPSLDSIRRVELSIGDGILMHGLPTGFASVPALPVVPGEFLEIELVPGRPVEGSVRWTTDSSLTVVLVDGEGVERSSRGGSWNQDEYRWRIDGVPLGLATLSITAPDGRSFVGRIRITEDAEIPSIDGIVLR